MDLKHTTKAELYRELCGVKKELDNCKAAIDRKNDELAEVVNEKDGLVEELRLVDAARKETLRDLKEAREANDKVNVELAYLTAVIADRNDDIAKLENELEEMKKALREELELAKEAQKATADAQSIAEGYHDALKWCIEHPWRNLWKCWKENCCEK